MKIGEKESGFIAVIKYICVLSKCPSMQPRCKYYVPGRKEFCAHLGNWSEGHQQCKSQDAINGYWRAFTEQARANET